MSSDLRPGLALLAALLLLAGCGAPPPEPVAASPPPRGERLLVFGRPGVAELDLATGKASTPVPTKGPAAIVYPNRSRTRLYLVTGRREVVEVYDVAQGKVVDTLSFSDPEGAETTRALIFGVAVDAEEKTLYAYVMPSVRGMESLKMGEPYVVAADLATGRKLKTVPAPPGITAMVTLLDGKTVYLMGRDVYALDIATFHLRTEVRVRQPGVQGEGETDIITEWPHFQENGRWYAVPCSSQDPPSGKWFTGIMVVDLETGVVDKVEAGPPPEGFVPFSALVSPDGKQAWSIFSQILTVDLVERRATRLVALPRSYSIMTISADGRRLFAAGSGSSVLQYDTVEGKVVGEVDLPFETCELMLVPR